MARRTHNNLQMSAFCTTCRAQRLFATPATLMTFVSGVDRPLCQCCGTKATPMQILKGALR